jgi:hypothetical protein
MITSVACLKEWEVMEEPSRAPSIGGRSSLVLGSGHPRWLSVTSVADVAGAVSFVESQGAGKVSHRPAIAAAAPAIAMPLPRFIKRTARRDVNKRLARAAAAA